MSESHLRSRERAAQASVGLSEALAANYEAAAGGIDAIDTQLREVESSLNHLAGLIEQVERGARRCAGIRQPHPGTLPCVAAFGPLVSDLRRMLGIVAGMDESLHTVVGIVRDRDHRARLADGRLP